MKLRRELLLVIIAIIFLSCNSNKSNNNSETVSHIISGDTLTFPRNTKGLSGKQLALIYCQKCHAFPTPDLLDKKAWKTGVLPQMGFRLGINESGKNPYGKMHFNEVEILYKENIFPEKPLITKEDWDKIVDYYLTNSPDSIKPRKGDVVKIGLKNFNIKPASIFNKRILSVSLLKFDSTTSNFFVGDIRGIVSVLDNKGNFIDSFRTETPAVDINFIKENYFDVLTIGSINPSDLPLGSVLRFMREPGLGSVKRGVIGDLRRPVDFEFADLNRDGLDDIVISSFGFYTGSLFVFFNKGNDLYDVVNLRNKPGQQKIVIKDLNSDGLLDIVSLTAQGDEGIFVYYNKGKGEFQEVNLLKFSPVNGSNYFDLIDFNDDGFLDILYVNGDNADYSYSLKDYHGISIYLNDGKNSFKKRWSYPMYGATKAIAFDYDKDGDLDIAAIAYFANLENNPIPFVYLENKGNLNFEASTLDDPTIARWLTMETGDFDKDGDEDIALGKYINSPTPVPAALMQKWRASSPYLLILENKTISKD